MIIYIFIEQSFFKFLLEIIEFIISMWDFFCYDIILVKCEKSTIYCDKLTFNIKGWKQEQFIMEKAAIDFNLMKAKFRENGLQPTAITVFSERLNEEELLQKHMQYQEILDVVIYFLDKFLDSLKEMPIIASVCDAEGYLLKNLGHEQSMRDAEALGIKEGVRFTEEDCGIDAISLTLKHKKSVEIVGTQHYHEYLHRKACYAVPIIDWTEDKVLGTISIMTDIEHASPLMLTLLSTVNQTIEREIDLIRQNHELNILNKIIMDTTRNGILVAAQSGKLIAFNAYAEHITGWKKENIIGASHLTLEYFGEYLQNVLLTKRPYTDIEITFTREKDQEALIFLLDCFPIFLNNGTLVGAFAQFRDYTEKKNTEKLLLNSEKLTAVGQMAASVAHEIRNPLTTIQGFIQYLEKDFREKSHYDLIMSELKRINFIVSEFLILSKPHAVHFINQDLQKIMDETVSLFQASANMNNILIEKNYAQDNIFVQCDENQLKQVFMNVFKNSVEALPYGGNIKIRTNVTEDKEAIIQIEDNGIGMTPAQIKRLGLPFYTTKDTGTGLGYMVIIKIIEQHQGHLHIESSVNKGTTIEIRLPLS